jgi:hypothetical protein
VRKRHVGFRRCANEGQSTAPPAHSRRVVLPAALPAPDLPPGEATASELGEPMGIKQVARLIGCSPWTVRQALIPRGLPHWRSRANGKLIFYQGQVVRWVLRMQRQHGGPR